MKYTVKSRLDVIRQNTTINPDIFGGWLAINSENTVVSVNNITLKPGERLDFTTLSPDVVWDAPIVILPNGGEVTLLRLIYSRKEK